MHSQKEQESFALGRLKHNCSNYQFITQTQTCSILPKILNCREISNCIDITWRAFPIHLTSLTPLIGKQLLYRFFSNERHRKWIVSTKLPSQITKFKGLKPFIKLLCKPVAKKGHKFPVLSVKSKLSNHKSGSTWWSQTLGFYCSTTITFAQFWYANRLECSSCPSKRMIEQGTIPDSTVVPCSIVPEEGWVWMRWFFGYCKYKFLSTQEHRRP